MNAIVFQLKRAHRSSMKACRWLIKVVEDMTPARFDIMALLRNAGYRCLKREQRLPTHLDACCLAQEDIVKQLGLHKSTVSEALDKLVELGWVKRFRNINNRRKNFVRMTALGFRRTREACKILFGARTLKRPVDEMVRRLQAMDVVAPGPFNAAFEKVWEVINHIARWFGDTSMCTMYDRQISYEMPPFSGLEIYLRRCFGPGAGPRLPDFVLRFLWERRAL